MSGIHLRRHNRLAIITLDNPKQYNAMSTEHWTKLARLLDEAAQMDCVATIVTGSGRFFSAGADVKQARPEFGGDEDTRALYVARLAVANADLARALYQHPKVLIAALNGPAIGLSAAILGYFDFLYSVDDAYLQTPFAALGLVAEGGSSQTFVQRLGPRAARDALIFGQRLSAQTLLDCGFLSKLFPSSDAETFLRAVIVHIEGACDTRACSPRS